jgi:hypothetical protein
MTENQTPLWAHNDTAVSSHGGSSVHTHTRVVAQEQRVSRMAQSGQHGSVFTLDPTSGNPPKHASIGNVQKNYRHILWEGTESGNGLPPDGFHPRS